MIDGLKLTMTGIQLQARLEERIRWYEREIRHDTTLWKTPSRDRGQDESTSDEMLECNIERSRRRIETLMLIRDYIVPDEVYRLGEFDLRFADLLPPEDWECDCVRFRTAQGFGSDRAVVEQT